MNEPEASSFDAMAEVCRSRIYRAACLLLGNEAEAQDATQQVFIEAWRGWARFEGRASPFTWLYRILIRVCARRRRRRWWTVFHGGRAVGVDAVDGLPDPRRGPDADAAVADDGHAVRGLLRRLTPRLRGVLVLRYVEDCSVPEIARALRIPEGTVKSRIHLALRTAERIWREDGK